MAPSTLLGLWVPLAEYAGSAGPLSAIAGQDREGSTSKRCDGTEMLLVEAHDAISSVAVCDHSQRAVGESKLKIRIARVEVSDRDIVLALQTRNGKSSGGQIGDEVSAWPTSNPLSE